MTKTCLLYHLKQETSRKSVCYFWSRPSGFDIVLLSCFQQRWDVTSCSESNCLAEQNQGRTTPLPHLTSKHTVMLRDDAPPHLCPSHSQLLHHHSPLQGATQEQTKKKSWVLKQYDIYLEGATDGGWRYNRSKLDKKVKSWCKNYFLPTSLSTIIWRQQCKKYTKRVKEQHCEMTSDTIRGTFKRPVSECGENIDYKNWNPPKNPSLSDFSPDWFKARGSLYI